MAKTNVKARTIAQAERIRLLVDRTNVRADASQEGKIALFNKMFTQFQKGRGGRKLGAGTREKKD